MAPRTWGNVAFYRLSDDVNRGVDQFEHYDVETRLTADFDAAAITEHDRIMALRRGVMMEEG